MSSIRSVLLACALGSTVLSFALFGCASDDDDATDEGNANSTCVKISTYGADGGVVSQEPCAAVPSECASAEKPCGGGEPNCTAAIRALCKDGAEKRSCVSSSLNGRLVSMDVDCQLP